MAYPISGICIYSQRLLQAYSAKAEYITVLAKWYSLYSSAQEDWLAELAVLCPNPAFLIGQHPTVMPAGISL